MKALSKICLCVAIFSFLVLGCSPEEDMKAMITIKSTTQPNAIVKITVIKHLEWTELVESKTDSAGHSSFEVPLQSPTIALIQIGKKYGEVYLAPGYRLLVKENGQDYQIPLTFSGTGADVNNYIGWLNSNVESIKWASGKGLLELDVNEFRQRLDSLKTTINNFHENYLDSVALSEDIVSMLEFKKRVKFSAVAQEFRFYKLNEANNKKWAAHKNGEQYLSDQVFKELSTLPDDVPFDSTLMVGAYADYESFINYYWRNNVYLPVADKLIGAQDYEKMIPLLSRARIKEADFAHEVSENLLAYNAMFWLRGNGITPETDSLLADFEETYQQSGYLSALNKRYDEFLAVAPGKPAPHFEGLTPEDEKVSVKDLIGKIIYIDVWATWCRPCVAEIPASIELQQKLANEKGIQFLNVSVDANRSEWEKFLSKNDSWTGKHINIEPEAINSFYEAYKISGIPAYMLIDQAGNIIDLKAPRPSTETIETEIRRLLAAGDDEGASRVVE